MITKNYLKSVIKEYRREKTKNDGLFFSVAKDCCFAIIAQYEDIRQCKNCMYCIDKGETSCMASRTLPELK